MTMSRNMTLLPRLSFTAALALLAGGAPMIAHAAQRVIVEKNHTLRVTLAGPAGAVVVGNPDIADVSVVDSRTIYIIGKGFGSSGVVVTGRDGRTLFDGEVAVTSIQTGAITVYKGLQPSLMVCSNICVADTTTLAANSSDAGAPAVTAPSAPAAPTPTAMVVAPVAQTPAN